MPVFKREIKLRKEAGIGFERSVWRGGTKKMPRSRQPVGHLLIRREDWESTGSMNSADWW